MYYIKEEELRTKVIKILAGAFVEAEGEIIKHGYSQHEANCLLASLFRGLGVCMVEAHPEAKEDIKWK